jgi:hypothetical protein
MQQLTTKRMTADDHGQNRKRGGRLLVDEGAEGPNRRPKKQRGHVQRGRGLRWQWERQRDCRREYQSKIEVLKSQG